MSGFKGVSISDFALPLEKKTFTSVFKKRVAKSNLQHTKKIALTAPYFHPRTIEIK